MSELPKLLTRLNADCLIQIGAYLTPQEVVSLETVTKSWQGQSWALLYGAVSSLMAETTHPAIRLNALSYKTQKDYFRLQHNMSNGKAASAHMAPYRNDQDRFRSVRPGWQPDLSAVASATSISTSNLQDSSAAANPSSHLLCWKRFSAAAVGGAISRISATRFFTPAPTETVTVEFLAVNDDGIMLVQLTLHRKAGEPKPEVLDPEVLNPEESLNLKRGKPKSKVSKSKVSKSKVSKSKVSKSKAFKSKAPRSKGVQSIVSIPEVSKSKVPKPKTPKPEALKPEVLERNVVYSPHDNTILWSEDTFPSTRKGKDTVYTASWERLFRYIVAYNFRTGARLWRHPIKSLIADAEKAYTENMRVIQYALVEDWKDGHCHSYLQEPRAAGSFFRLRSSWKAGVLFPHPLGNCFYVNVVYSMADDKVLWQEDTDPVVRGWSEQQPYLLGDERVYTSQRRRGTIGNEDLLVAYDFRTGAQLYKSRPHLEGLSLWTRDIGSSGRLLGQVEHHLRLEFSNIVTYPASQQMAIVDYTLYTSSPETPEAMTEPHAITATVVIFKYYSYHSDTRYSHQYTDAVLLPRTGPYDSLQSGFPNNGDCPIRLIEFNPFFMTALVTPHKSLEAQGQGDPIHGSPRLAEAALKNNFQQDGFSSPAPLRRCLTVGEFVPAASAAALADQGQGRGQMIVLPGSEYMRMGTCSRGKGQVHFRFENWGRFLNFG
ncbi:hypothetical protein BDW74DRAFT_184299 [Aspergillus multicolor]|uniref:uncharacterized protein n=1 Tax=Aspergillus multicolor TaxID=41759 RepID=UPI003CCC96B1